MAYTSVEAVLHEWFDKEGLYDKVGRGGVQDLAERVTAMIKPFRNYYRMKEGGWENFLTNNKEEIVTTAHQAEKELEKFFYIESSH